MVDIKTGAEQTTNDFRFTWCPVTVPTGAESPNIRMVVPKSYKGVMTLIFGQIYSLSIIEAMVWLEGKRALELGAEIRGSRKNREA